jgi:hypothetical protein
MSQNRSHSPENGLVPVPVAVLLPRLGETNPSVTDLDSAVWTPQNTALIAVTYTRAGDLIADLDGYPALKAAAESLGRRVITDLQDSAVKPTLVCARIPRPDRPDMDCADLTEWMHCVRLALRPGGFLLATVSADSDNSTYIDRATTTITAARAAGLIYQQHLIAIHTPPSPQSHRDDATPSPASHTHSRRQVRTHSDVFVFASIDGGHNA